MHLPDNIDYTRILGRMPVTVALSSNAPAQIPQGISLLRGDVIMEFERDARKILMEAASEPSNFQS